MMINSFEARAVDAQFLMEKRFVGIREVERFED
jgi:hypothetical protein